MDGIWMVDLKLLAIVQQQRHAVRSRTNLYTNANSPDSIHFGD